MATKPTINKPDWANAEDIGTNVTEPIARKATGFIKAGGIPEKPTYQELNFLFKTISEWITYLETFTDELDSDIGTNTSDISSLQTLTSILTRYVRPRLIFNSASTVNLEDALYTNVANDVTILFPDGVLVTENSLTRTQFDITRNAVTTVSGYQSGLRSSLTESNDTWYALYAVKCDDGSFVTVGDTTLPLPTNHSTLDTAYGANSWVYLGMIRNGNNENDPDEILDFVMDKNETHFRHDRGGGNQVGIELSAAITSVLAYTYSPGTGADQIPDHLDIVNYGGFVSTGAVTLNMQPTTPGNSPYLRCSLDGELGYGQVWSPSKNGMTVSTGGVSVAVTIFLNAFRDPYL